MSNPFTAETGAQQPPKTYVVEEYAKRFNAEVLTPYAQSVGFKTYHFNSKIASVPIIVDEQYLKSFCQFWETAVKEIRQRFGITETEVVKSTSTASEGRQEVVSIPSFEALFSVLLNYLSSPLAVKELTERAKLRRSGAKTLTWSVSQMAARPTLQTSGLTSVPEDNSASSPARKSAKVDVLKRLRPPPLPAIWCWWVEKVKLNVKNEPESSTSVPGSAKAHTETKPLNSSDTAHEVKPICIEEIRDIRAFWGTINHFPFHSLKFRDSVHLFQRGIKPRWEDPVNMRGGSWTFRVPKPLSLSFFTKVLLLAVGGQMLEVATEFKDRICGISMSIRFNSNLVTIWNFDRNNQKSIDAILALVLEELPEDIKAKDISYFYKKHYDHQGFDEAIAAAKAAKAEADETKESEKKVTATKRNLSFSESATNDEAVS